MMMVERFLAFGIIAGLALAIAGWWQRDALPEPSRLTRELAAWPDQEPTDRAPFKVQRGGVEYTVKPLYRYDIRGLVVTLHVADSFTDWVHKAWNDHINVTDLCLAYGGMATKGMYQALTWWSGNFTCNFQSRAGANLTGLMLEEFSNNHVLTASPTLAKKLRGIAIGDQVRMTGYLAEYSHTAFGPERPFRRGTSTTRSDTGDGACETIWVENVEILRRASRTWRMAMWGGLLLMLASVVGWFCVPYRARD